jgi:hypothetical protein
MLRTIPEILAGFRSEITKDILNSGLSLLLYTRPEQ